jgi:hypothetical protein
VRARGTGPQTQPLLPRNCRRRRAASAAGRPHTLPRTPPTQVPPACGGGSARDAGVPDGAQARSTAARGAAVSRSRRRPPPAAARFAATHARRPQHGCLRRPQPCQLRACSQFSRPWGWQPLGRGCMAPRQLPRSPPPAGPAPGAAYAPLTALPLPPRPRRRPPRVPQVAVPQGEEPDARAEPPNRQHIRRAARRPHGGHAAGWVGAAPHGGKGPVARPKDSLPCARPLRPRPTGPWPHGLPCAAALLRLGLSAASPNRHHPAADAPLSPSSPLLPLQSRTACCSRRPRPAPPAA